MIWQIKTYRSYALQVRDYFTMMILCLLFFVIFSAVSVYTIAQLALASKRYAIVGLLSPYLLFVIRLTPLVLNWLLFSFVYFFFPNTKVKWESALIAGVLAGTTYHILQWFYIYFQVGVGNYGAIYGSFAALPLFLVWVNLSWTIVLGGAELAYQLEIFSLPSENTTKLIDRKQLGFIIVSLIAKAFFKGEPPLSDAKIAGQLGLPPRIVLQLALELCDVGILMENHKNRFLIARNPEKIHIKTIFDALEEVNNTRYSITQSKQVERFENLIHSFESSLEGSPLNLSLKSMESVF